VDESIKFFRANILFQSFEIRGDADKVMVFLTVFIQKCLETIAKNPTETDAKKNLQALVGETVPASSDPKFFMSALTEKTKSPAEEEKFRQYMKQLKEECVLRLFVILFNPQYGPMDLKFWLAFAKRKFLKYSL